MRKVLKKIVKWYLIYNISSWWFYGASIGALNKIIAMRKNEEARNVKEEPIYKDRLIWFETFKNFKNIKKEFLKYLKI